MYGYLIISSCAPSRFVKPLEKGKYGAGINLGGPLFDFSGMTIPIPFSSIGGGYGLTENTTIYSNLHTTSLLFGVYMIDAGITHKVLSQKGYQPAISISPALNLSIDQWEGNFKCWPQLDMNSYWNFGKHNNLIYVGVSNMFELASKREDGLKQKEHWLFSPQLGYTLVRPKMEYGIEVKYIEPFTSHQNLIIEYKSIGNNGAFGIYLNLLKKF